MGQKPGDAVVDASTVRASPATRGPSTPFPARGPESVLLPSPARCRVPQALARPSPAPTPYRLAPSRQSRLATQRCLLSQDWFRGGSRRADSPPAGAPGSGPGAAPSRHSRTLPSAVRQPTAHRPAAGPLLPDAKCRLLEVGRTPEVRSRPWPSGLREPVLRPRPRARHRFGGPFCTDPSQTFGRRRDLICL